MLFNSLAFLIFFPVVVLLYYALPARLRWVLLLIASYIFYMSWKVEYILLIVLSTIVDYYASIQMSKTEHSAKKKRFLYLSLFSNLGILFTFKYFNFFSENVAALGQALDLVQNPVLLDVILPVGISFYTFQTMSYSIDVYYGRTTVEKHFGRFALFVSFFPQLVAGPIERSQHLLPQFRQHFTFDYENVRQGLMLMAWGLFKKVVIADRVAYFVNIVYNNPADYYGFHVLFATFFFAIQIFCDFSGYSDIAIGAAKVMGFDLMKNFDRPYLSRSIGEFWRRWHISLSSWFRDYVYIPMGGNRVAKWRWYYNLFITFLVSGLWHGAAWTFIIWGGLHGFYLMYEAATRDARTKLVKSIGLDKAPLLWHIIDTVWIILLVCFAWIFFRANSLSDSFLLIGNMFQFSSEQLSWEMFGPDYYNLIFAVIAIFGMEVIHIIHNRHSTYQWLTSRPMVLRWSLYVAIVVLIINFGVFTSEEFIYFQF